MQCIVVSIRKIIGETKQTESNKDRVTNIGKERRVRYLKELKKKAYIQRFSAFIPTPASKYELIHH